MTQGAEKADGGHKALRFLWVGTLVAVSFFLAYQSAISAVVGVTRVRAPETALRYQPDDALAQANLATMLLLTDASAAATRKRAVSLARRSLHGLALNPAALRVAVLDGASSKTAEAALRLSEKMSRRDVATQLMLIETAVQANNVDEALSHYDTALRVHPDMGSILYPVLASAGAEQPLDPSFVRLFRSDPPWANEFIRWAVGYAPDLAGITPLIRALPSKSHALSTDNLQAIVAKLAESREFVPAFDLYRSHSFDAANRLWGSSTATSYPPLDWRVASNGDLSVDASGEKGDSITFEASGSQPQTVMDRVVSLPPGHYLLAARGTSSVADPSTAPYWYVVCADASEAELAKLAMPTLRSENAEYRKAFRVSQECPFQWLRLRLSGTSTPRQSGTIANLRLVRISGG